MNVWVVFESTEAVDLKEVLVNASEFFLCDQSNVLFCVKEKMFLKMSNLFYVVDALITRFF